MAKQKRKSNAAAPSADYNRNLLATLLAMLAIIAVLSAGLLMHWPFAASAVALAILACLAARKWFLAKGPQAPGDTKDKLSRPVAMLLLAGAVVWPFIMLAKPGENLPALIVGSLLAGAATWFDPCISGWLKRKQAFLWIGLLAGSLLLAYYLNGQALRAKWWPIDDHEIMTFAGPGGDVKLTQIPSLLMQTEVGSPGGDRPRYRPSYYSLRIFETFLWGTNPSAWWAARLAMLALTIALLTRFFMRLLGLAPAVVLMLLFMTYVFWTDIWCRLGPGEAYCALGTGMFLEGFAQVFQNQYRPHVRPRRTWPGWALLTLGAVLAMGSKENFLLMLLPVWTLAAMLWRRHRLGLGSAAAIALVTLYGLFIAAAVGLSVSHAGKDIYGSEVSAGGRLGLAWAGIVHFLEPFKWWDVLLAGAIVSAACVFLFGKKLRLCRKSLLYALLATGGMLALYVSQFIFYNGRWPLSEGVGTLFRYDFPGIFARPLAAVAILAMSLTVMTILGMNRRLLRMSACALVTGVVVMISCQGFGPMREASSNWTKATNIWTQDQLQPLVDQLKDQPTRPVVFVSAQLGDFEPVFSAKAFFRAYGVANPLYLRLLPYGPVEGSGQVLYKSLKDVSEHGGEGFLPLGELPTDRVPFGVGFSIYPPGEYVPAGVYWPLLQYGNRRGKMGTP